MSAFEINFPDYLAPKLQLGAALRLYHVYTPAVSCPPIFTPVSEVQEESTTCESHFLAIAQYHATTSDNASALSNGDPLESGVNEEILVFGIEVLIFDCPRLTTIFVSKADSTGFLDRKGTTTLATARQGSSSIIRTVTSAFLEWLVSQRLDPHRRDVSATTTEAANNSDQPDGEGSTDQNLNNGLPKSSQDHSFDQNDPKTSVEQVEEKRLVLSLFARSQNQYLFPGSIENETKHVLDDRQLIKWWCRVLDALLQKEWPVHILSSDKREPALSKIDSVLGITISEGKDPRPHSQITVSPRGYLIVPGCDRFETTRLFLPASARSSASSSSSKWSVSYPAEKLNLSVSASGAALPVRCMIPRLPDDPKARFCDDLDDSGVDEQKNWKAVKTLDQFWELMSYRQECSAGRLVGFAWTVFDLPRLESVGTNGHFSKTAAPVPSGPSTQQQYTDSASSPEHTHPEANSAVIVSNAVPNNHTTIDTTSSDSKQMALNHEAVLLSSEDYNKLAEYLINTTDFAGLEKAKKSTRDWIAKVKELSGATQFGATVHGKALLSTTFITSEALAGPRISTSQAAAIPTGTNVNVLVGVRKRKRNEHTDDKQGDETSQRIYGTLTSTSTTKAGQSNGSSEINGNDGNGARVLAAGLLRKKPKPKPKPAVG